MEEAKELASKQEVEQVKVRDTVTIGNRTISVDDVASIALREAHVTIDNIARQDLQKAAATLPAVELSQTRLPTPQKNPTPDDLYSITSTRAILALRATTLLQGRPRVRVEVIELLAALLNENVIPQIPILPTESASLEYVACALAGEGLCWGENGTANPIAAAIARIVPPVAPLRLSVSEFSAITSGLILSNAMSAIAISQLKGLLDIADAVAATTCEALQAHMRPFDSQCHELAHAQKGNLRSVSNLRAMWEASKQIDSRKDVDLQDPSSIRDIPQFHGPARTVLDLAFVGVQVEMNSTESGPTDRSRESTSFNGQTVSNFVTSLHTSLLPIIAGSERRIAAMLKPSEQHKFGLPANLVHTDGGQAGLQGPMGAANCILNACRGRVGDVAAKVCVCTDDLDDLVSANLLASDAAMKAVRDLQHILGIELAAALQAISIREHAVLQKKGAGKKAAAGAVKGLGLGKGAGVFRGHLLRSPGVSDCVKTEAELKPQLDAVTRAIDPSDQQLLSLLANIYAGSLEKHAPKIPKGTRDFSPEQMAIREVAFNIITNVFKRHGAVTIDTPVFELKETLTGKYGEDSKLIYDLADQGGELLALRYDLTVPFARYLAMNTDVHKLKRYHISRVYRRDTPNMSKGRYREFFQCDFDIAGEYDPMIPDAEVLMVMTEILDELPLGNAYEIKLNHRKLLDAMMEVSGVPAHKFRTICSSIDKLDKEDWATVRREMVDQKGISEEAANKLGQYVGDENKARLRSLGPLEMLAWLKGQNVFGGNAKAAQAFADLTILFEFLTAYGILKKFSFDLSLARGLDYYTGIIYEAVLTSGTTSVGSICGGGRYDDLVGMFDRTGRKIPAVGVSIGIERIFNILDKVLRESGMIRKTETLIMAMCHKDAPTAAPLELCAELWANNIRAEHGHTVVATNKDYKRMVDLVRDNAIPYLVYFDETARPDVTGTYSVRFQDFEAGTTAMVKRDALLQHIQAVLAARPPPLSLTTLAARAAAAAAAAPAPNAPAPAEVPLVLEPADASKEK
eukprot:gnl/Hemi2/6230_TR2140_c0_g1_i1.p1 gnl/Hemi2/6230_TR2140_c0_g1~~gnl/Hemi2/6230_TR2140_c0_g1_i1.p1  ORF type:complete len:1134 (-),score=428.14 gnl/Hemi2/6230_TR2140_c0_g1_i1:68-3154(-)